MERHQKALAKIRELEQRVGDQAHQIVLKNERIEELEELLAEADGVATIAFLEEVADSKSKFASTAQELLDRD